MLHNWQRHDFAQLKRLHRFLSELDESFTLCGEGFASHLVLAVVKTLRVQRNVVRGFVGEHQMAALFLHDRRLVKDVPRLLNEFFLQQLGFDVSVLRLHFRYIIIFRIKLMLSPEIFCNNL